MQDLTSVRVVNAKHKDGSLIPMLLTSSEIIVSNQKMYSLLFEPIRSRGGAVITACQQGIIQTCSDNVGPLFGVRARTLCGKPLCQLFLGEDVIECSLNANTKSKYASAKYQLGAPVEITASTADGPLSVVVEVVDSRNNMFVVTVKPKSAASSSVAKKVVFTEEKVDVKTAKGGVDPNQQVAEEEIGYYTVTGALGVGQCGMVRKGTHRTTGTQVAVKTLAKDTFAEVGLAWPGKEPELMKYLHHPNIVQLYDSVMSRNRLYLVMELVNGGELLSYCFDTGPLPEVKARQFFRDILAAVDYLHRKGIVHRDLKLENCLLDTGNLGALDSSSTRVKIIDFGLANFYLSGTLKTSCGSADYAAPELFTSSVYYGPPVDVWAMGVMLYSMVAGEFPFDDIQATLDGEYVWPIRPSKQLENMIGDLFELNPDLRLTMDQIRRHEWVNTGYRGPPDRPPIATVAHTATPGAAAVSSGATRQKDAAGEVRRDVLTLRLDVLVMMEKEHGFATEAAVESILNEDINQFTATYKMLLLKFSKLDAPCESEELERVKVVVHEVQRQREIGQVGKGLNLTNIRSAVRLRHKSGMAGTLSAPSSPRDLSGDSEDILSTNQLAKVHVPLPARRPHATAPVAIDENRASASSAQKTFTRERSQTFGGSPNKSRPNSALFSISVSPQTEEAALDVLQLSGSDSGGRRRSVFNEVHVADDPMLAPSRTTVEREISRNRLTGGSLGSLWSVMRSTSSSNMEREYQLVLSDHGS
jgi:serine/threonine protein kinase